MKHLFKKITVLAVIFATSAASKNCTKVRSELEANSNAILSDPIHEMFNTICRGGLPAVKKQVIDTCGPALSAKIEVQCCHHCVTNGRKAKKGCAEILYNRIQRVVNGPETREICQSSIGEYFRSVLPPRSF